MAILRNPFTGDDPDPEPEDGWPDEHAPECSCPECDPDSFIEAEEIDADIRPS